MRILGRRRPGRLDSTVATGESNRKPFLRHRKAMGIFESTNGGRLAHSGGRSLVDRAAWQQPMNFVTLPDLSGPSSYWTAPGAWGSSAAPAAWRCFGRDAAGLRRGRHQPVGVLCLAVDSLTQTKRKCRSRPADARGRIRLGNCLDLDLAARTGDGDKLLARATDEFALGVARGLEERVQACRASGPCWPGRTRRALWADAAACTVRTT
jgi:hypothetical protein